MAGFENKDLTGALFKNEYKQKDSQPDVSGTCRIGGIDYKVAGWNKTTKGGVRMVSLAFTEKSDVPVVNNAKVDLDDEIMF